MHKPLLGVALVLALLGCSRNAQTGTTGLGQSPAPALSTAQVSTNLFATNKMVASAQFTPDGRRIVTTGDDGTVRLWDVGTGQPFVLPRYQQNNPDNMPVGGPDNFQVLQQQIDALNKRLQALEKKK